VASTELPEQLLPLVQRPDRSALFLDFDGTLAPIVEDPVGARPLSGVPELLGQLAHRLALVAVVSGRPTAFLTEVMDAPAGVTLVGLYGLELALAGAPGIAWAKEVDGTVIEAGVEAPDGVYVEPKGLSLTLHWRRAPDAQGWVEAFAQRQEKLRGFRLYRARSSIELQPPVDVDKGTVVRTLVERMPTSPAVIAVFGDDLGDLPAFDAAAALHAEYPEVHAIRVAAVDEESPTEVAARADLTVDGALGAVALLLQLAQALG
jgi:trehalose 6-phosphate phosphatase